jgi:hypothetical protein
MSFTSFMNAIDKFAPRCSRCNRKIHNGLKCRICSKQLCSESCFEKHYKMMHAGVRNASPSRGKKGLGFFHLIHLFLTLATGGLWLPIWILHYIFRGR